MPLAKDEFYGDKPKRREAWLRTLPSEVRNATDLTEYLKDALTDNKISEAAEMLAVCIQNKVWEHIAIYDDDNPEIKTYHPMVWCREVLKTEPGELMKVVVSPIISADRGAAAAVELIEMVRHYEVESFVIFSQKEDPSSWYNLLKTNSERLGGKWCAALDLLIDKKPNIRGNHPSGQLDLVRKVQELRREGVFHKDIAQQLGIGKRTVQKYSTLDLAEVEEQSKCKELTEGTRSERRRELTTKEGLRRRLNALSDNQEKCKEQNTTTEKVKEALSSLLNGESAAACLRMAGLAKPPQPEVRLRCKQDKSSVASRIIELLKPEEARELADEIITQLAAA